MAQSVIFYELTSKFVDSEMDIPDDAQSIMYYTLAVGHHTGVMDCFTPRLTCSVDMYRELVSMVEDETARYKLEGIFRFGEIQVDKNHAGTLRRALNEVRQKLYLEKSPKLHAPELTWLTDFIDLLEKTLSEPGLYLMGRWAHD